LPSRFLAIDAGSISAGRLDEPSFNSREGYGRGKKSSITSDAEYKTNRHCKKKWATSNSEERKSWRGDSQSDFRGDMQFDIFVSGRRREGSFRWNESSSAIAAGVPRPVVVRSIYRLRKMMKHLKCCVAWCALAMSSLAADDPIFDVESLSSTPLNAKTLKSTERDGIVTEEVRFHSETDGGKDVEIFAYFSYPQGARRLPAFIWNPGGLGQASMAFTETPARRGYAVLCIDFPMPGYRSTGNYPINTGLELGADPKSAPIFHGVVALLKAVTYLQSRPEVDPNRIGMAGSSWGGFFTTLMIGIDPRLKAGSCLYGSGGLQLGNAWWDGDSRNGRPPVTAEYRARWAVTLDPAWRLPSKKTPIAWFTGTNDRFYPMPALMETVNRCGGPTHLTLLPNWDHALPPYIHDEHVYAWLDVHLQGKPGFATVSPVAARNEGGSLIARWDFEGDAVSADLIASYGDDGNWVGRYWQTLPAVMAGQTCSVKLPASSLPVFISGAVVDARGLRSSTPLVRIEAANLGIKTSVLVPH
jgi:dienelactone hydrolase